MILRASLRAGRKKAAAQRNALPCSPHGRLRRKLGSRASAGSTGETGQNQADLSRMVIAKDRQESHQSLDAGDGAELVVDQKARQLMEPAATRLPLSL